MNFSTSKNKFGVVLDGPESRKDYVEIDNVTYVALPLSNDDWSAGRGKNATVLRAVLADNSSATEWVLKINNTAEEPSHYIAKRRRGRFVREIGAYKAAMAEQDGVKWVLRYLGTGFAKVGNCHHQCILLEKADFTLGQYLQAQTDLTLQQRLLLCYELLRAFTALHSIGIYHRDIKPENLFMVEGAPKIGDLGLVKFRGEDDSVDQERERIGPIWWMAPEAVNRCLCVDREETRHVLRSVGAAADAYQVGKLLWYIIQGDVPNGIVRSADMRIEGTELFGSILKPLLQYDACLRPSLEQAMGRFEPLRRHYGF